MPRARASLVVLSSKMSAAEVAERLGRAGDMQWDSGDPVRPGSSVRQKISGWSIESQVERSVAPAAHVDDLLKRTGALAPRIEALEAAGDIDSSRVWLHLDSPETGFSLEPSALRAMAELGSLEVDIYG